MHKESHKTIDVIRRMIFFIALIPIHLSPLFAGGSGSVYSRFGFGEVRYFPSERSAAMGGATIAVLSTNSLSTINPATWTQVNRMRFSVGVSYDGYSMKDNTASTFLSSANFNGVVFGVPVSTDNGIVVSAGLTPYSKVNYDVVSSLTTPEYAYILSHMGEGGLSSAHLGVSSLYKKDWHFGLKFDYLFGTLKHITEQRFTSPQSTKTNVVRSTRLSGANITIGAIFTGLGEMMNMSQADNLTVGAVLTTGARLSTKQDTLYEYSSGSTVIGNDTSNVGQGTSLLPLRVGLGMSYTTKERYLIAFDVLYQNWSAATLLDSLPPELRDSYRISVGTEILPQKEASASYGERTAYRFGLFYNATNLRINNTGINEFGITAGIGLPMFGETRFNIGVEYSIRGTIDLEKDNILRIMFTLNASELWFNRPPEE